MNTSIKRKALYWTSVRHRDKDQFHGNQDSLAGLSQSYLLFSFPGFLIVSLGLRFCVCVCVLALALAFFSFLFSSTV